MHTFTTLALAMLLAAPALASAPKAKREAKQPAKAEAKAAPAPRVVEITVTEKGYEPSPIKVKAGEPLLLKVTRKTEKTCATEILIKGTDINVPLPLDKTVEIPFTPAKTGEVKYGCAMGMMISGVLTVE